MLCTALILKAAKSADIHIANTKCMNSMQFQMVKSTRDYKKHPTFSANIALIL